MKKEKLFWLANVVFMISVFLTFNSFGATYYVKNGGNDTYTGLSDAQAWASISKVKDYVSGTGDDVYFKCGDTWNLTARLTIDWSGTDSNRAVVGAYYMDGSNEIHGVQGNKPVFDGNNTYPTGDWEDARWGTLVHCFNRSYVTVENLRLINSRGHGLNMANTSVPSVHLQAIGVETDTTISTGIQFYKVENGLIENCDVKEHSRIFVEHPGNDWPAGIAIVRYSENITVRGCCIHEGYGEGLGAYFESENNIFEDNILYANRAVGIYLALSRGNIVRRNLLYNLADTTYWRSDTNPSSFGIGICDEPQYAYAFSENNAIYDNVIAFFRAGISISSGGVPGGVVKDTEVYNNTIVDCIYNIYAYGPYENSFVRNNIFWNITTGGDMPSGITNGQTYTSGLTWSNNNWTTTPPGDLSGTGDVIGIPQLAKTSGWRSFSGGDLHLADFALQSNSPCIDTGAVLSSAYQQLMDCDVSDLDTGTVVTEDQASYGSGWEIGGDIYTGSSSGCVLGSQFEETTMSVGMEYYTDRTYTLTDVPPDYIGLDTIKTPNDDRNLTDSSGYLTFEMPYDGVVYVGFDPRATSLPDWMSGFAYTGDVIGTSLVGQDYLNIYSMSYNSGDCVDLGANKAAGFSGWASHYIVFYGEDGDSSLVANLHFDDGSGSTAVDSSENNNYGTLYGDTAWTSVDGDYALEFDGANDYVQVSSSSSLDSLDDATVILWAMPYDVTGSENVLWMFYTSNTDRVYMRFKDAYIRLYNDINDAGVGVNSPDFASANTWYHIALVVTGNTWKVYVNADATPVISHDFGNGFSDLDNGFDVYVGARDVGVAAYDDYFGILDEVKIYNRALSLSEIIDDYGL